MKFHPAVQKLRVAKVDFGKTYQKFPYGWLKVPLPSALQLLGTEATLFLSLFFSIHLNILIFSHILYDLY
jgi:hypothetical protein